MHPVLLVIGWRVEERGERHDEVLGIARASPMEPPGRGEDNAGVVLAPGRPCPDDASEVLGVFRYERPAIGAGMSKELLVGQGNHGRVIASGYDVMALMAQSLGRSRRMVCVEQ